MIYNITHENYGMLCSTAAVELDLLRREFLPPRERTDNDLPMDIVCAFSHVRELHRRLVARPLVTVDDFLAVPLYRAFWEIVRYGPQYSNTQSIEQLGLQTQLFTNDLGAVVDDEVTHPRVEGMRDVLIDLSRHLDVYDNVLCR